MFGFLEYIFFNFSIVVLLTKLNPVVVCWKPWPWIFVVKAALIWVVLVRFFCVFSQSESICNLHSCYTFCTRVTEELHSFLSQSELSNFFVYIIESEEWSSQWIFQFKQLERRSLKKKKKSGLQRDSNPWPPRCRCVALPTELWSHTLGARSIYWDHISREEWNDVNYMK